MPIARNESQAKKIIYAELKAKVAIEVPFIKALRKQFKQIVADKRRELGVTKSLKKKDFNIGRDYTQPFTDLLRTYYKRGSENAIGYFVDDEFLDKYIDSEQKKRILNDVKSRTEILIERRARTQAREIIKTTENNYKQSYDFIDKLIEKEKLELTEDEYQSMVMSNFEDRLLARSETIAVTETQNMYQQVKNIEAYAINEVLARNGENLSKRWDAELDSNTRPAHAAAHGQIVPLNSAFKVGGDQLMFPSDTSLGAGLENIINCRCTVLYVLYEW